jgi:tetratricopeptide (TPR) repeat protein
MTKNALKDLFAKTDAALAARDKASAYLYAVDAVKLDPKNPEANTRLVRIIVRSLGKPQEGLPFATRALNIAPRSAELQELAAEIHCHLKNYEAAAEHARTSFKLDKTNADRLFTLGMVLQKCSQFEEASEYAKRALRIQPDHIKARLLQGELLTALGKREEAEALVRQIFAESPNNIPNMFNWSRLGKPKKDDPMLHYLRDTMIPALRQRDDRRLPRFLKLLGRVENEIGNYREAFLNYREAKERDGVTHDPAVNTRFVGELIGNTSRADYFGVSGHQSECPVLLVGMPRTGSTLLEQVLSSHPQVGGIGESETMRRLATSVGFVPGHGKRLADITRNLSREKAEELASIYLEKAQAKEPGKIRIVDKNLHNFELLGFFAKLFPRGRVLLALRDPLDNCVSCYMQPLSAFHSYTTDLSYMGRYYREFRQLTDHWEKVIPNKMLRVPYEDMVGDTEGKAREVIDFLGLEWDPACLDFQKKDSYVKTLSVAQVRQPIYQSSVKRWKRYDEFLDPLKKELKSFYPDGF